ncbi:2'-5' RNA ligase family protein [Psychrobacillus sp. NPDC093200]|uniref:2'-5' RNA ligase family protein n=1 Tax=Psychrobacillus sp. NPDC093200 TaxID=3390656 RepID=UPI003D042261
MYGIIALFDEETEQQIIEVWNDLKDQNISSYASEVKDRKPHITIASYKNLNVEQYIKEMDRYLEEKVSLTISFETIGSFINSGALFYSPLVTKELMDFHMDYHEHFKKIQEEDSLYNPGRWIPHCTIANRLTKEKLLEAMHHCSHNQTSISGFIKEIALIDTSMVGYAPILYSKKLKII